MQYDNVKRELGRVFNRCPFLRKCFYFLLDTLLLRAWHVKRELRRLKKTLPDNASALDAGAGFGQYTYYMSRLGRRWHVKAVDVKEEQVEDCNRFFARINLQQRVRFEVADLTEFSEPESYHLALSVDVMEHIADDTSVFENIFRSLKPGGVLLISTPSDRGGSDAAGHHDSFIDEHVRNGYNIDEIREKLRKTGFHKVEASYTYGVPGHLSWILSMKTPLRLLNISRWFFLLLPAYYIVVFPFCLLLNLADVLMRHSSGTGLKVKAEKAG
ncbi:MAG: methyltransferase domain-containing protein [Bacteroidales bacterium]|jgi:2-polyprenyl-3-methyl-5-hydroxy-6-metoxy-1,4-benzoquinol methylase|nr:methyltransferase domain-containing protein [Bacteroidales bacterium]